MFKNQANQRIYVFCWTIADGQPLIAGQSNLTAYYSLDGTADSVVALSDPQGYELDNVRAPGWYSFQPTAAETNSDSPIYFCTSSDTGIACRVENPAPTILLPAATAAEIAADLAALVPFNVITLVAPNFLDIFRGDAYLISQGGRELGFTYKAGEPWPDTIDTAKFYCEPGDQLLDDNASAVGLSAIVCTVAVASGSGRKVILELTEANTTLLVPGVYDWWIVANDAGDDATIRSGTMRVRKRH